MLRIDNITLIDENNETYKINANQIENFPLIGGEAANMITTKVWSQHGNSFINALMNSFEGEITFVINTENKSAAAIEEARQEITNMANPLKGKVTMQVTLNSGAVYNRDVTFVAAPSFPTGFENRNNRWQRVQLLYEANNPFWYAANEIVESFVNVEPSFIFPFDSYGRTGETYYDFNGKIAGSDVENPNYFSWSSATTLIAPSQHAASPSQTLYNTLYGWDESSFYHRSSTTGAIPQLMFRWNVIEGLERKFGTDIWNGATTLADKITRANEIITRFNYMFNAYGTQGTANKLLYSRWDASSGAWTGGFSKTTQDFKSFTLFSTLKTHLDTAGNAHFLLYVDPVDAATAPHEIRTDYVALNLELDFGTARKPLVFGGVVPNKIAENTGQVDAPMTITIKGACVNPKITNITTGEFIKFKDLTMTENDEVVIETGFGEKKVELNGVNIFNKLDFASTFFNLVRGANEIDFTDDNNSTSAKITFNYKNLYITI